ncbi:MAG TPA: PASTA domain-containing protein [Saprospiraceae bacterium]|nr:PASTA domain-containing protein [Saprospiraceae bacterium]
MKLKAGIFWGGGEKLKAYQSASAILQKLDPQLFEPMLYFIDEQRKIYAVDTNLFRKGGWSAVHPIAPERLKQSINFAFVELWGEDSAAVLNTFEALGIPYVGQRATNREGEEVLVVKDPGEFRFSCLVLDQLEEEPLALYPRLEASPGANLTQLQLEQIRSKALQLYRQLDLGPFARIRGRYTGDDLLLFDTPQVSYPLTEGGYLEQDLAPYHWTATECCTYSVLVSLRRRFRENPGQKAYPALYEHLLSLCQGQEPEESRPLTVLIGATGSAREVAQSAALFFTKVGREITDKPIVAYECLSANSNTELRPIPLAPPVENLQVNVSEGDPLYTQIKARTESLKAVFLPGRERASGLDLTLSKLDADFVYLCLSGKFNSGFLQYALDERGIAHSGTPLQAMQKLDRLTSAPSRFEPGMVHLKSSVWCGERAACQVLGHSLIEKDGQLITPARHQLLVLNDTEVQRNIEQAIRTALATCQLRAYAVIESYLRIFEDNSVQLSVVEVEATPLLAPNHILFAHAKEAGLDAKAVFNRLLDPILTRNLASQNFRLVPTMVNENEEELEPRQEPTEQPSEYSAVPEEESSKETENLGFFAKAWQGTKNFITAPIFLRSLGGILIAGLLFFVLINVFLGMYTRHGSAQIVVDNYLDKTYDEARRQARGKGLKAVITDSTFVIGMPPNMVIEQDPEPGSKVKKRRTVYLWVTGGQAPDVLLPSLAGKDDFETYQRELDRRGIALRVKERQFDRKLEENTILGFYYQGEPVSLEQVRNGFKVPKGSTMQAIVSKRSDGMVAMPDLVCQTFESAKFELESNQLKIGEVYGTRNNQAYVWKQEPAYAAGERIPIGSTINLHLTAELPAECQ